MSYRGIIECTVFGLVSQRPRSCEGKGPPSQVEAAMIALLGVQQDASRKSIPSRQPTSTAPSL